MFLAQNGVQNQHEMTVYTLCPKQSSYAGAFAKSRQHFSGKPRENMVEWLKTSSNG